MSIKNPLRPEKESSRASTGNSGRRLPTLELRTGISPTDDNMRSLRYLMESIKEFGGPIGQAARCLVCIGADEPPRDLKDDYDWASDYPIDFKWVDRDLFKKWSYHATGCTRFWVESDADIVAFIDVDLLISGNFDSIVEQAYQEQEILGFMAHVSPFGFREIAETPDHIWWKKVFDEAGLETPELTWQYSGWGMDWSVLSPRIVSFDQDHRFGPPYFNYGFVIGPRAYVEKMGETIEEELEAVTRVRDNYYKSQVALSLALQRHKIPCGTLPINYNFPLNIPGKSIRAVNQDPHGENGYEHIKIFHYIGGRKHFESVGSVRNFLNRNDLSDSWRAFQEKLRIINRKIEGTL